jgi:hypothetical protein
MQPASLLSLALVLAGSLAAQQPAATSGPAKTSLRLKQEIQGSLPKYAPPPPQVPGLPISNVPEEEPNILALPKFTVREKRAHRIEPNDLLTTRELNRKFAREYRNSLSGLDALLNRFTIPILSPSAAERGRALHVQRQFEDAHRIAEIGKAADADNSTALQADVEKTKKDLTWRNRPAGDGRKN